MTRWALAAVVTCAACGGTPDAERRGDQAYGAAQYAEALRQYRTLTDGKAHSVDSSDVAFQTAAGIALREMASESTMCLLEPIDTVTVTVDDDYLGAVMTDIGTRRGQILGSAPAEGEQGRSVLEAAVPQLELLDYAISLLSLAHGTGTFHREYRNHEQLPDRLAKDHVGKGRHA